MRNKMWKSVEAAGEFVKVTNPEDDFFLNPVRLVGEACCAADTGFEAGAHGSRPRKAHRTYFLPRCNTSLAIGNEACAQFAESDLDPV